MTKAEIAALDERFNKFEEEVERRFQALEKEVLFAAPVAEPDPEPEPVLRITCEGVASRNDIGKKVIKTVIATAEAVEVPTILYGTEVSTPDKKYVFGGYLNDLTDAHPDLVLRLYDEKGIFRIRYHAGSPTGPVLSEILNPSREQLADALAVSLQTAS